MTIEFNPPQRLANYNTQDIKDIFDKNDISVFLDSAFERKRINQKEYSFLLNFLTTHDPKTLKAEDIHNLPNNNIYSIQKYFDEYNTSYIEAAYKQRLITEHEFKSLYKIYNDGMEYYSQVYDICLDLFGDPIYTTGFDMSTGKANKDEDGQTIDYTTKVLTPFVETRVKFQDRQGNALYIMFPKIKSAHRTIDKLTKEIGKSSRKNLHTAFERYLDSEDKDLFDQICVSPLIKYNNKTIELHDITRLTITSKYLSGSKRLNNVLKKYEGAFGYTTDSPRNRFEMPLYENSKKYFDTKLIITLLDDNKQPYDVEIQLKIDTLYRADMRTHKNYEKYRKIIESISDNDPNKETKLRQAEDLEKQNRQINEHAIHEYNMIVMDKIQRKINNNLKHRRNTKNNDDGTYTACNDFIADEYLIGSYEPFDPQTAFDPDHYTNGKPINKMCFLKLVKMLPKNFDEFSPNADEIIEKKFQSIFEPEKYEELHHIRKRFREIQDIAQIYSHKINEKIIDKIINDMAEAQVSFIIDEKYVKTSFQNETNTPKKHTEQFSFSPPQQIQNFDPQNFTGKLCILKLLRRLPKDFPQTNREMKDTDIKLAEKIYTDIFNNPTDKDHVLLSRLLKVAISKKDEIQNKLEEKIKNKTSSTIINYAINKPKIR